MSISVKKRKVNSGQAKIDSLWMRQKATGKLQCHVSLYSPHAAVACQYTDIIVCVCFLIRCS